MLTVTELSPPAVNVNEILRYARCAESNTEVLSLLNEVLLEAEKVLIYRAAYVILPLTADGDDCNIGGISFKSKNLSKILHGCDKAIVFAATVGVGLDRLITKYSKTSPTKALMLQAIGAERVEALCDALEDGIKSETDVALTHRFSPGYGDLSLQYQREISNLLELHKSIGAYLNDSLLFTPSKTVTAIVGAVKKQN